MTLQDTGQPLLPSEDSPAPKVNGAMIEKLCSGHFLQWALKSAARVGFHFLKCQSDHVASLLKTLTVFSLLVE